MQRVKPFLLVSFLFLFILSNIEWELLRQAADRSWISPYVTFFNHPLTLVALMIFFAYDKVRLPSSNQIQQLGVISYGVYLIHVLALEVTARATYHVLPWLLSIPLLFFLILVVAGLGLPVLLIMVFENPPVRRFYKYAFG